MFFNILAVSDGCGDYALANILFIIQKILFIIQIAAPILAILALTLTFGKMLMNPDDKKGMSGIKNTIIALLIVFLLPFVINFSMSILANAVDGKYSFEFATCWDKANTIHSEITGGTGDEGE